MLNIGYEENENVDREKIYATKKRQRNVVRFYFKRRHTMVS